MHASLLLNVWYLTTLCVLCLIFYFFLQKTLHNLAVVDDDERIAPLVKTLKNRYLGEDFSNAGTQFTGAIKVSQLDSVSCGEKS